jgi:hypothetical protein
MIKDFQRGCQAWSKFFADCAIVMTNMGKLAEPRKYAPKKSHGGADTSEDVAKQAAESL